MLTPFDTNDRVDLDSLETLTDWYLQHGADSLFAVCQSSEMQHLSVDERRELAAATVRFANGKVPVLASGHVSDNLEDQIGELIALAGTGIDCLVLVTNRLDPKNMGFEAFRHNLEAIMASLPADLPLGLYECPAPYRRLLSDEELTLCRDTGRFVVLKDVSCDLETVERRLKIVSGTDFAIINANAAIAYEAMRLGSPGFAGVFTNFHPDLYAWLLANKDSADPIIGQLVTFLALAANAESAGYPVLAKLYHQRLGTITSSHSRTISYDVFERHWALDAVLDHIHQGTLDFRDRVRGLGTHQRSA
jgi:4-hydroxy-tetrahydrodipicolinate synthase